MKRFLGFISKEFRHIFRDRRTLTILFGLPIIQLILFGFAIRNELKDADLVVVDLVGDHVTREIVHKLASSGYFRIHTYTTNIDDIEEVFRSGRARAAVVFEPEFASRLAHDATAAIQLITDASDPNFAGLLEGYLTAIIRDYERELAGGAAIAPAHVAPALRMHFNPELKSANLFVPGLIAVILMLISAMMTSITIAREKEVGTMEILLVSPLRPIQIIAGKVAPYFFLSFANVVTVLVLARAVFGVPFEGSVALFVLQSMLFIVTALSLGILISTVTSSQQAAMLVSMAGLLLPTIILSGFIFPVANMPPVLQYFSHIVPAKWFLIIVRGIMLKGIGLEQLWQETLILAGMAMLLLVVSVKKFKTRLE